jgi:hypothetical protein
VVHVLDFTRCSPHVAFLRYNALLRNSPQIRVHTCSNKSDDESRNSLYPAVFVYLAKRRNALLACVWNVCVFSKFFEWIFEYLCKENYWDRLFASSVWLEVEADINSGVIFITYGSKTHFGPGRPPVAYHNTNLFTGLAPNPQPGEPGLRIYDPGDRVAELYPQS